MWRGQLFGIPNLNYSLFIEGITGALKSYGEQPIPSVVRTVQKLDRDGSHLRMRSFYMKMHRIIGIGAILITVAFMTSPSVFGQNQIWQNDYGGSYNELGYAGFQTSDGGYLILGSTYSYGAGEFDIYLIKTDAAGGTVWTRTYGGSLTEYGYDVQPTTDGGFILVGSTKSSGSGKKDIYLIKTDSLGAPSWSKTYGGAEDDEGWSVRATTDNGYIICGTTSSFGAGYGDLYLIKIDSIGDTLWTRAFGGTGGESGMAVREIPGSGYIAIGSTGTFGEGYSSMYVVRADTDGDSLWATTYGGSKSDMGNSVEITSDGGFVLIGSTASFGAGYTDAYLVKTDSIGNLEWQKEFGGTEDDRAYSVCLTRDGGYIIAGTTGSSGAGELDAFVVKTDFSGAAVWTKTYGDIKSDYGRMIFQNRSRDYILVGYTYSLSAGGADIYMAKIQGESTPVEDPIDDLLPTGFVLAQNYPNPFNSATVIEYSLPRRAPVNLTIYNIVGQVVREWLLVPEPAGNYSLKWNGDDNRGKMVASGLYLYRLTAGDFIQTKKMILIK
jgi:hypothetical protein